jgi:hypothetical protein
MYAARDPVPEHKAMFPLSSLCAVKSHELKPGDGGWQQQGSRGCTSLAAEVDPEYAALSPQCCSLYHGGGSCCQEGLPVKDQSRRYIKAHGSNLRRMLPVRFQSSSAPD